MNSYLIYLRRWFTSSLTSGASMHAGGRTVEHSKIREWYINPNIASRRNTQHYPMNPALSDESIHFTPADHGWVHSFTSEIFLLQNTPPIIKQSLLLDIPRCTSLSSLPHPPTLRVDLALWKVEMFLSAILNCSALIVGQLILANGKHPLSW